MGVNGVSDLPEIKAGARFVYVPAPSTAERNEQMEGQNVLFEINEEIGLLTINRPKKMNTLDAVTLDEIRDVFDRVKADEKVRILIVTGSGEKAFVAGADISGFVDIGLKDGLDFIRKGQEVFGRLESLGIPSIAAVNGLALGGGCELAMACTFRIVSHNAKFGLPELALGVIPGYGGTQRLARMIGKSRALWLMLTGEMMGAEEAFRVGLANMVVEQAKLLDTAFEVGRTIRQKGPLAVRNTLIAVHRGADTDLQTGLIIEAAMTNLVLASRDKQEGVASFLEKRKPVFRGE